MADPTDTREISFSFSTFTALFEQQEIQFAFAPFYSHFEIKSEPWVPAPPVPAPWQILISSVIVLSPTQVRVNFDVPALLNAALINPANYVITPTLAVTAVSPEPVAEPTYVILTTDEQKGGTSYNIEIQVVEAA